MFAMAYPFLKKLSARLKCLMTYTVGQLCITTIDFSINDPTAYVICSIYSIPVFLYFVTLNCVKKPTLALNISESTHHIYLIFLKLVI